MTAGSSYATATPTLLETGGADVNISAFYGTSDKGATETGWDSNVTLGGAQSAGQITLTLSGLSASTNYVFRIKASNSAGTVWSDAYSVLTNSQAQPPAISASAATSVAGSTATTNGELLSYDGSDLPSMRLYYGDDIDFQLGWREAHLTGDTDSGISSSHTYTAAVNVGSASSITINGVSFSASGNNASTNSGTGWTITQGWGAHGSDAWVGGNTAYQSTVGGKYHAGQRVSPFQLWRVSENQNDWVDGWQSLYIHNLQPLMGGKPNHEGKLFGSARCNLLLQPG